MASGSHKLAAERSSVPGSNHYLWLDKDERYADDYARAKQHIADSIEGALYTRAVDGVERETGWYKGEAGGTLTEYDTTAAIFMLKGLRPGTYADRKVIDVDVSDQRTTAQLQAKLAALLDRNPEVARELAALADPRDADVIEGEFSEGGEPPIDGRACVKVPSPVSGDSSASKLPGPSVGSKKPLPGSDLYAKG